MDLETKRIDVPGTFGDGLVPVHIMRRAHASGHSPLVILLHGVHGSANPLPGNKYGELARMLIDQGASCALVETSRVRRDRETFGEDREAWARAAFKSKTFFQDHADAVAGVEAAAMEVGMGPIWIFGFSLGGIHAVLAAGSDGLSFTPAGIALGGSGYRIRSGAENDLTLPMELAPLPQEKKNFIVIEGADHAFRSLKGNPSLKPLEMISSRLAPLLF
ncbi:MAG: hypothetical protein XD83_0754 [Synergistales bacterium 57_84]|nr:MAG: hypothetical protein XD83_0754 [Synergistales bacterium 57_84]